MKMNSIKRVKRGMTCVDPERFVRGGQIYQHLFLFCFKLIRKSKTTIIGPSSTANVQWWLGSFVLFHGIRTAFISNPIFL